MKVNQGCVILYVNVADKNNGRIFEKGSVLQPKQTPFRAKEWQCNLVTRHIVPSFSVHAKHKNAVVS